MTKKKARVLVACEESQAVTKELRALDIEAYSCDIEPCSGGHPEWHIQGDVIPLINQDWTMIIAFPSCTHLAVSGARYFEKKRKDGSQQQAIDFFMLFANAKCEKIAIENPVGIMSSVWRKPDQIIQPWMFGHNFSKKTCLWLKNLPILNPGEYADFTQYRCKCNHIFPAHLGKNGCCSKAKPLRDNQTKSGQNNLTPSPDRAKKRSKTYPGIAKAMAEQWSRCLV